MTADELAQRAHDALAADQNESALLLITQAVQQCENRPRLAARLWAWKAQALMNLHRPKEAQSAVLRGLSLAKKHEEKAGIDALRSLHQQILARMAIRSQSQNDSSSPLRSAIAAYDRGDLEAGTSQALKAFQVAQSEQNPRDQVLALLALARTPDQTQSAILQAHEIAQDSEDLNLVTAVAKAAKATKIVLPVHVF